MSYWAFGPSFFDQVCQRYGDMLHHLLPEVVYQELEDFLVWAQENAPYWSLLKAKNIPVQWWKEIWTRFCLIQKTHQLTYRTLSLLQRNGRLYALPLILRYIEQTYNQEKIVYLVVPRPLMSDAQQRIHQSLEHVLKQSVSLRVRIDTSLMAGGMVLWDHNILDTSLSSLFKNFQQKVFYVL